ncbi:hypothetical protein ASG61_23100 [Bacillus sp. Leaf75]|nr:hypothetical protein ASG61_23100 [Bacillus sp. Leaf75]
MTIGLTKKQVVDRLSDTELNRETVEVVAKIIEDNNKLIEKKVSDIVMAEWSKKMGLQGL